MLEIAKKWKILQSDNSDTFVLATGKTYTVRSFVEKVCNCLDLNIDWQGENSEEVGIDSKSNKKIIKINPEFYRPAEVDLLIGDPSKAKSILGWEASTSLDDLCKMMVSADLRRNSN